MRESDNPRNIIARLESGETVSTKVMIYDYELLAEVARSYYNGDMVAAVKDTCTVDERA